MGTLYGIGLGPGDPELITVKGLRLIRAASVVFVPAAAGGRPSYARAIAEEYLEPSRQTVVELTFPLVRDRALLTAVWDEAALRVIHQLPTAGPAVFLTEGDPLLYSTFIHLYQAIGRRCPEQAIEIVPGVTSFTAAAAVIGLPLVAHGEQLALLPATRDVASLRPTLRSFDTTVLLKVAPVFDRVLDLLEAMRLAEHAVWVQRAGRPEQAIEHDIRRLRGRPLDYFSLLIVHNPTPNEEAPA